MNLKHVQRVNVGVPAIEPVEQPIASHERVPVGDLDDALDGALVLAPDPREEALGEGVVGHPGVALGDLHLGTGERERGVVERRPEERPLGVHLAEDRDALLAVARGVRCPLVKVGLDAGAERVPPGEDTACLGPREHPRDRSEVLDGTLARPRGRPRSEVEVLDYRDRRGLAEERDEPLALKEGTVLLAGSARHCVHRVGPRRGNVVLRLFDRIVAREELGVQHLFEVALGDPRGGVLLGDRLALFGELDFSCYRTVRQRAQRLVHRAAATRDRPAAPVKQPKRDVVVGDDLAEAALVAVEFPVRREEPVLLVRVGVAQHDLLGTATGGDRRRVGLVLEQRPHDPVGTRERGFGFEQRHHVQS